MSENLLFVSGPFGYPCWRVISPSAKNNEKSSNYFDIVYGIALKGLGLELWSF